MNGRDVVRLGLLSAPRRPIVTKHAHRTSGVPLRVNCSCATRKQLRGPLLSVKNASPCADLELATHRRAMAEESTRVRHNTQRGRPSKRNGEDLPNAAVSRCEQRPVGMDAYPPSEQLLAFDAKQTPGSARFYIHAVEPETIRLTMCVIDGSTVIRPCRIIRRVFRQSDPFLRSHRVKHHVVGLGIQRCNVFAASGPRRRVKPL